jgi:hypothetical protein
MLNDGHNTSLSFATKWARSFLEPLLNNDYFMNDTLILLTYDESEDYSKPNQISSLLLGGAVDSSLRGTEDGTFYTHYSILSTLQNNWGLPNLGRYDVGANVFSLVASKTGYNNHDVDMSTVNLSTSYPGFLSSKSTKPIPPPNLKLVGAGGKGVVDTVVMNWRTDDKADSPYDGSGKPYDGYKNLPVYASQAPVTVGVGTTKTTESPTARPSSGTSGAEKGVGARGKGGSCFGALVIGVIGVVALL